MSPGGQFLVSLDTQRTYQSRASAFRHNDVLPRSRPAVREVGVSTPTPQSSWPRPETSPGSRAPQPDQSVRDRSPVNATSAWRDAVLIRQKPAQGLTFIGTTNGYG